MLLGPTEGHNNKCVRSLKKHEHCQNVIYFGIIWPAMVFVNTQ